jgi:hypothetical protein
LNPACHSRGFGDEARGAIFYFCTDAARMAATAGSGI